MAEGGSFQIASGYVRVTAQPDENGTEQATNALGGKLAAWAGGLGLGALITKGISDNLNMQEATAKLQAQMGLTKGVASDMGKLSGEVYRDNFGGSINEVNDTIRAVGNNFGDLGSMSKKEIKGMTESALGLATVFGTDVEQSTEAAGKLMRNGLAKDGKEAFDIITKGMQMGLDRSGDFLETLNEYSPQFTKLGITGPQSLGLMSQALKAGARDTDGIADAFKEFSLRAIDGSTLTAQGFKAIGLDAGKMAAEIGKGGPAAQKATAQTIEALKGIKDPVKQNQAGVALFGTQWEDTLRQVLPSIDLTKAATVNAKDATQKMNDVMGQTPQAKIEGVKRTMEGWLMSATQLPGPLGTVGAAVAGMGSSGIMAAAGLSTLATNMSGLIAPIGNAIKAAATWALETTKNAIKATASMVAQVARQVAAWVMLGVQSMIQAARVAAAWLISLGPIAIVIAAVVGLVALIIANWDTIKRAISAAWEWIKQATVVVWENIKKFMKAAFDFLKNIFLNFTGPGLMIKHWNTIKSATTAAWNAVKSTINTVFNWMKSAITTVLNFFKGQWNSLKTATTSAFNAMRNTITSIVSAVTGKIRDMLNKINGIKNSVMGALRSAGTWLVDSGKKLIQGFINGISSMAGRVGDAVKGVLSKARNLLPFSPAKEGPFSGKGWTSYSGASIVDSMADGITSRMPHLASVVGNLMSATAKPIQNAPSMVPNMLPASTNVTSTSSTQQRVNRIEQLHVNIKGILDPKNPSAVRELIAELHDRLDDYVKEYAK